MQDIAGCRLVVANRVEQDMIVFEMVDYLPGTLVHDRREAPRHGYRAVHVLSTFEHHPVEVQVRTILQHTWAEASERLSDVIDPAIKYGGGPSPHRDFLQNMATNIALWEEGEVALWELAAEQGRLMPASELPMKEHRERVHAILLQALRDYSNIDTVDEQ